MNTATTTVLVTVLVAAVFVVVRHWVLDGCTRRSRRERFSLGNLVNKVKDAGKKTVEVVKDATPKVVQVTKDTTKKAVKAAKVAAPKAVKAAKVAAPKVVKATKDTAKKAGKAAPKVGTVVVGAVAGGTAVAVAGSGSGGDGPKRNPSSDSTPTAPPVPVVSPPPPQAAPLMPQPPAVPAVFVDRVWDGTDWLCPHGTVDLGGGTVNTQACASSMFTRQVRDVCPFGTVPTGWEDPDMKCEVGWIQKSQDVSGAWVCPDGTVDSGKTWSQGLIEGAKQCRMGGAHTRRIQMAKGPACPKGSVDTGKQEGQPNGQNQCRWKGP